VRLIDFALTYGLAKRKEPEREPFRLSAFRYALCAFAALPLDLFEQPANRFDQPVSLSLGFWFLVSGFWFLVSEHRHPPLSLTT
jgi:hypothetical protein